jgi:hypothetical protein
MFLMRSCVPSSLKLLYGLASGFSGAHASMFTKISKFKN